MKLVVTGGRGFLGTHFMSAIRKRADISVRLLLRDFSNAEDMMIGADCIVHLAGVNRDTHENIAIGNVEFTKNLLNLAHRCAPTARILFSSSSQVYSTKSWY